MKQTILILTLLLVLPAFAGKPAQAGDTAWKLAGQLEEACSCDSACPCWFGKKPTHMTCGGGQVLFISKGKYGDVALDGLALAQMTESPEGKSMMESMGHMQFDTVYIDEKATEKQRAALQEVIKHVFPPMAPARETRFVPITRTIDGKEHHVTLGKFGTFSAHLMEGGLGGPPKVVNPPLADPIHKEYQQGETTSMTYTDNNRNWNFQGSNFMFTNFEADSATYAKFEAEMAKKMEAMKK